MFFFLHFNALQTDLYIEDNGALFDFNMVILPLTLGKWGFFCFIWLDSWNWDMLICILSTCEYISKLVIHSSCFSWCWNVFLFQFLLKLGLCFSFLGDCWCSYFSIFVLFHMLFFLILEMLFLASSIRLHFW